MQEKEYQGYVTIADSSNFMYRVYGWMAAALAISAITAYTVSISPTILGFVYRNPTVPLFLFIGQLALVIAISGAIHKMSATTASALFLLYAFLTGLTLSSIFLIYTSESIFSSFFVAAAMFGAMCLYGYFTKSDLSSLGSIMFMGLIGLIIAMFINMFLHSSTLGYMISIIGVFIFTALTAYDVQRIKRVAQQFAADHEMKGKVAIIGALTLYLDFLNLFLFILRLMGSRRRS